MKKLDKAGPLLVRSLELREDRLGPKSPGLANILTDSAMSELARLAYEQQRYAEAESLARRSLKMVDTANAVAQAYRTQELPSRGTCCIGFRVVLVH